MGYGATVRAGGWSQLDRAWSEQADMASLKRVVSRGPAFHQVARSAHGDGATVRIESKFVTGWKSANI